MASGGLDIWVSSTCFQKNNIEWLQQPPTEKVLKSNMTIHDSTKKIVLSNHFTLDTPCSIIRPARYNTACTKLIFTKYHYFESFWWVLPPYQRRVNVYPSTLWKVVFCFQNCSDMLWEKIVLVIEIQKNFWNSRLKAEQFTNSERSVQFLKENAFWTCSLRFPDLIK